MVEINTQNSAVSGLVTQPQRDSAFDVPKVEAISSGEKLKEHPPESPQENSSAATKAAGSEQDLELKVAQLNANIQQFSRTGVRFRIDQEYGELLISVVDLTTGSVVRQIPSEEILELSRRMEELQGLLFDEKA